jgi:hypothetical protein
MVEVGRIQPPAFSARLVIPVCTDNLNAGVAVMKSAKDGA